jgi:hypothetical protein
MDLLIGLLIGLLILAVVLYVAHLIVSALPVAPVWRQVILGVIALIALLILLDWLGIYRFGGLR